MKCISKIIRKLAFVLVLTLLIGIISVPAIAQTAELDEGLFIATPLVPDEVIEYAQSDFSKHY